MKIERYYIGGWFQRTMLHLSEIHDFIRDGKSPLELDPQKLADLRAGLDIDHYDFIVGDLERLAFSSSRGVNVSIYEDGLIVMDRAPGDDPASDVASLTSYYEQKLSPAISYLFSLGAPVPKELANIKTIYPYFVVLRKAARKEIDGILASFGETPHFSIRASGFELYRGDKLYVINALNVEAPTIARFIEEQIFIREFKTQMHRYLNLHRIIWERIAEVKERGKIKGSDISPFRDKIEGYFKTINFIEARINQMDTYIRTRAAVFHADKDLAKFSGVLQFKYETLADTLEYIRDLWGMTKNYVQSALDLFGRLQAQSTESSVKNLTVVTSMGVGATLLGLFSQEPPSFTLIGALYFFVLAGVGYGTNTLMKRLGMRRMYRIRDIEAAKDI
jgi:hypothetical protein